MSKTITIELEVWRAIGILVFGGLGAWKLAEIIQELFL